jgi:predicted cupin superfamily sugar epimerase
MLDAREWIERLGLKPHQEGGYFRETYRAAETIAHAHLPPRFSGDRAFSTAIYFLLEGRDFSALHRIHQDEMWHFYDGCPLLVSSISPEGRLSVVRLGRDVRTGYVLQAVVPAGDFFGARPRDPDSYSLVGCTVAPGFDFADFELPTRGELVARFPQHATAINDLTRDSSGDPTSRRV